MLCAQRKHRIPYNIRLVSTYQMRWNNSAWAVLQHVDFIREDKEPITGRGIKFTREKPSRIDVHKYRRIQGTSTIEAVTQEPRSGEVLSA